MTSHFSNILSDNTEYHLYDNFKWCFDENVSEFKKTNNVLK